MKTTLKSFLFLFLFAFSLQSCEDNDDVAAPADVQINSFIWKGLNEVYLWQADVPNLADNRFATENDFNNFLVSNSINSFEPYNTHGSKLPCKVFVS